jgi:HEAT repeat protein
MSPYTSQILRDIRVTLTVALAILLLISNVQAQEPISPEISAYLPQLRSSDKLVRRKAAEDLSRLGRDAKAALPYLVELLSDQHDDVRLAAVNAIGHIGNNAKEVSHELLKRFDDSNRDVRLRSAEAFAWIGQTSPEALSAIIELLQHDKANVRESAAYCIAGFNLDLTAASSQLRSILDTDPSGQVRASAAYTLAKVSSRDGATVTALTKALTDKSLEVKLQVIESLAQIGPDYAKTAIPEIIPFLDSQDFRVRDTAANALTAFGPESRAALPRLIRLLKDPDIMFVKVLFTQSEQ